MKYLRSLRVELVFWVARLLRVEIDLHRMPGQRPSKASALIPAS